APVEELEEFGRGHGPRLGRGATTRAGRRPEPSARPQELAPGSPHRESVPSPRSWSFGDRDSIGLTRLVLTGWGRDRLASELSMEPDVPSDPRPLAPLSLFSTPLRSVSPTMST